MKTIFTNLTFVLISSFYVNIETFAANTPDYYQCKNAVGGEWNYGRAPKACDANSFGSDQFVVQTYSQVIFIDQLQRDSERNRYMEELNAIIKESAVYYIQKRKPQVSAEETKAWTEGILATASNESYWSHYRKNSDGKIKMMRGDFGHGHGLMQIDDRGHFPAIQKGIAWNMMSNLTYAMDIFYQGWEKAVSQACVGKASNYTARTRSAWSAYNGGPSKICRWTNTNDKWAKNDQNFYNALKNKLWNQYIKNNAKASSVNVSCLIEKQENCQVVSEPASPEALVEKKMYTTQENNLSCIFSGNEFHCVDDSKDNLCLQKISSIEDLTKANKVKLSDYPNLKLNKHDRHDLCQEYDQALIAVAKKIETQKTINLRATPGGGLITAVPASTVMDTIDFELRNSPANDRYYQVKYQNQIGWIFAGNKGDQNSWVLAKEIQSTNGVAQKGQTIQITSTNGINLRETPGGKFIEGIPYQTSLIVNEIVIKGNNNEVYYQVKWKNKTGYIYSGILLPQSTVKEWTVISKN